MPMDMKLDMPRRSTVLDTAKKRTAGYAAGYATRHATGYAAGHAAEHTTKEPP